MFGDNTLSEISVNPAVNGNNIEAPTGDADDAGSGKKVSQHKTGANAQELDSKASLLFGLIRDFKVLADRACAAALRESHHSSTVEEMAGAELSSLRLQLKEKIEALDSRDSTLREREALAKNKVEALESALRDKEEELENCQIRARALFGEMENLNVRLNDAANAMKQAESRFRDFAEHQQGKISFLCQELKSKEHLLQAKEAEMRQLDEESRLLISSLENRLQTIDGVLQIKDAELREQQSALESTAAHEKAFAQLMQELTVQSEALMAELSEKNELVSELENKTYSSFDNAFVLEQSDAVQERLL